MPPENERGRPRERAATSEIRGDGDSLDGIVRPPSDGTDDPAPVVSLARRRVRDALLGLDLDDPDVESSPAMDRVVAAFAVAVDETSNYYLDGALERPGGAS